MVIVREIIGVLLSVLYVTVVLVISEVYTEKKKNINKENSRKVIHILTAHYIFIVCFFNHSVWFAAIPSLIFIVINALSKKFNLFKSMERDNSDSFGTIWYSVSATLVVVFAYSFNIREIAIISILILGYGDGLAALIGIKYGKYKLQTSDKTFEGSITMFFVTAIIYGTFQYITYGVIDLRLMLSMCVLTTLSEYIATKGLDNLLIPFTVSTILICNHFLPNSTSIIFVTSLIVLFVFLVWLADSLTLSACFITVIMMFLVYFSVGVLPLIGIVVFLVSSSIASIPSNVCKNRARQLHKRNGVRSYIQVLANGSVTVVLSVIFYFTRLDSIWFGIFVSLAVASSDTFSSEIGMLSKSAPISILTFKKTESGLSGGITFLGFLGSLVGASIIGSVVLYSRAGMFISVVISGVIGSMIDSFIGAALQIKYITPEGEITEKEFCNGKKLEVYSGIRWINNDYVNFISILLATFLSVSIYQLLLS
ncbi:DUF92 domain-containing protein [Lacrimispora algidixylanolytica]|uniref:DUF92 domain-containing protein n=1 Tax=Lacrimispora algidixylanolytica TaxID=94868 RepID=A0A419T2W3_9FIRM|nr:DUF92 domain-containing protein [Lacrimispora algidixylanolytica]RKD31748.1 hypothetical protein BET01_19710 [Lacrimispora algidixylanolytica]